MNIEFKKLEEIPKSAVIDLMNNFLVRRQMPLLQGVFTEQDCEKFVNAKKQMWEEHGYGPWAFVVENSFAGWGGIQPEDGEADLALVLHPNFWGLGKKLYKEVIAKGFNDFGLPSVQVLFPPTRTRIKGLLRLGFRKESELKIGNQPFVKFRLKKSWWLEHNGKS